jgi:hypothetical protein
MLIEMGHTGTRALHKAVSGHTSPESRETPASQEKALVEALSDLHDLLEDYSPAWYTEEHHRKAESALHTRKKH